MKCSDLPDLFRNVSVVGVFSPFVTSFYCQEIQLILSEISLLYFFPLFLISKQNNLLPFDLSIFQIFVNCYHALPLGIILPSRRLLSVCLSQPFSYTALPSCLKFFSIYSCSKWGVSSWTKCSVYYRRCHIFRSKLYNNLQGKRKLTVW